MSTNVAAFGLGVAVAALGLSWWATRPYLPRWPH